MTRLESWRGVPVGTHVIVRRSDGSHFHATTVSRAFEMLGGAAVIRVDGNAVQDYYAFAGRTVGAHRVSCMLAHGEPPAADSQACHDPRACVTRLCCNPAHLRWDSPAGNQHDVRITLTRRGERNPKAKLTEAQAREIWRRRGECGYVLLARKMGLPEKAVRHVVDGTNWAWATGARRVDRLALAVAIVKAAGVTP